MVEQHSWWRVFAESVSYLVFFFVFLSFCSYHSSICSPRTRSLVSVLQQYPAFCFLVDEFEISQEVNAALQEGCINKELKHTTEKLYWMLPSVPLVVQRLQSVIFEACLNNNQAVKVLKPELCMPALRDKSTPQNHQLKQRFSVTTIVLLSPSCTEGRVELVRIPLKTVRLSSTY